MSGLYAQFKTDKNLEISGIRVEYHDDDNPEAKPETFIVRRAGGANVSYNKALDLATRPMRRAIAAGSASLESLNRVQRVAFIDTVLIGWENIKGPDEKEIPFSRDAATKLFNDLPDLFEDLQRQANTAQLFRISEEVDAKN